MNRFFEFMHNILSGAGAREKAKSAGLILLVFVAIAFIAFSIGALHDKGTRSPPIILVYHDIRDATERTGSGEFVTPEIFERQMAYLAENGFAVMSLEQYFMDGESDSWRKVILTFDDAWKSQYEAALPLLERYGFGATFFINSAWIEKSPFLIWDAVRTIAATPHMEIGGHTKNHLHLVGRDRNAVWDEIVGDKKRIEKEIQKRITSFSYPYGEYTDEIALLVKKSGYVKARGTRAQTTQNSAFSLPAIIVPNSIDEFVGVVSAVDYNAERIYWRRVIDKIGPAAAYALLKSKYALAPTGIAHNTAHVFGEILYARGIENLSVCDVSFIFGCYHGFLGRAISERGTEVLQRLDRICVQKRRERLGCHHGIGHGIMTYFGDDRLAEALEACGSLSWKGPVAGCYGGLFMEYNFRNAHLEGEGKTYVRAYHGDPYDPCPSLPLQFMNACFYEQPDWWRHLFNNDFKKLGDLCLGIPNAENREFCFIGVGRMAAQSMDYDMEKTKTECGRMPNPDSEMLCRSGGFLSIYDFTLNKRAAQKICDDPSEEIRLRCLQKANLFGTAL
ncbi:MAG: polysaccharide deacetylase family protein [Patescibacteria group bacterium]